MRYDQARKNLSSRHYILAAHVAGEPEPRSAEATASPSGVTHFVKRLLGGRHRPARKTRDRRHDIRHAAQQYPIAHIIDDDQPARELRLGSDTHGPLLEIDISLGGL